MLSRALAYDDLASEGARRLVRDCGDFDDALIIEPLARLSDDVAQGIVEVYGLVPGGVLP